MNGYATLVTEYILLRLCNVLFLFFFVFYAISLNIVNVIFCKIVHKNKKSECEFVVVVVGF